MGWKDAPQVAPEATAWASAPVVGEEAPSLAERIKRGFGNAAAGAVRGAGSIGATALAPIDIASDLIAGKGLTLESNRERRQNMDQALGTLGADTDSGAFTAGKIGSEVAGTLGVGGALGNLMARVPWLAQRVPGLVEAVRTSGMRAGGGGRVVDAATRAAGGATTGAASAALVDPETTATGAGIGAVLPGVVKAAGAVGKAVGNVVRGPAQAPATTQAVQAAQRAGYVIPPTQASPTLANRLLEGLSGKASTAQNASARNQAVTNRLAADALGLPADTKITADVLLDLRDRAGRAYADIGNTGMVTPSQAYGDALDKIAQPFKLTAGAFPNAKASPALELVESLHSPGFAAASAVEKIKQLRTAADDAFRSGNTDIGRAAKAGAKALEDAIEEHLRAIGQPQLLASFKDARALIAKTYTVEKALNQSSGNVNAKKLAADLNRGKPITGPLREAADFANQFPKATQTIEGMGSLPQTSPLDWLAGGALNAATGNPLMLAAVGARPAARSLALSPVIQKRLVQAPRVGFQNPALEQLFYRAAPVLAADQ